MNDSTILRAAHVAAAWHGKQRRKGVDQEPYVNHLLEVALLVAEANLGNDQLVIAALLHDAIEDQQKSRIRGRQPQSIVRKIPYVIQ